MLNDIGDRTDLDPVADSSNDSVPELDDEGDLSFAMIFDAGGES